MEIFHEPYRRDVTLRYATFTKEAARLHWHERIELVIPLAEPFSVMVDGAWQEVKAGDVILIAKNKIHAFSVGEGGAHVMLAQFPYRFLLRGDFVPQDIRHVIHKEEIAADPAFLAAYESIYSLLVGELESGRATEADNPFTSSLFPALYFLLMRRFALDDTVGREGKDEECFHRVVAYVNAHFTESITVGGVARALYIDRGRLSRLFMALGGMSLSDYITSLRLMRASELIKEGKPITEAALDSGFQSVRTFHEVYRRMMHAAPRNLRNN